MSIQVKIWNEQDVEDREFGESLVGDGRLVSSFGSVVGHSLVLVVKKEDGSLDVERVFEVNADSAEDNQIVTDFVKSVESKLAELFEPVPEPSKIWVPA